MLVFKRGDSVGKAGVYIHIPFCRSKCPYCDFYSMKLSGDMARQYTESLAQIIKTQREKYSIEADTLYFGGGTPSIIGADNIIKLVNAAEIFGSFDEITVECNPSAVDEDFFEKLSSCGVNRISLGLQSAVDSERRSLGRLAGVKEAGRCIDSAHTAGIDNISLDVMLGIPSQTEKSLDETLSFCIDSGVKHISAYMLKLEENTYFYKNREKLNLPDDDFTADAYLRMVSALEHAGFMQYEISNFAVPGFESRHNLKYWCGDEYLGFGPAAHSFIGGKRFYWPRDIDYFMNGGEPYSDGDGGDIGEYIMLALRLKSGISYSEIISRGGGYALDAVKEKSDFFEKIGLAEKNGSGFNLTPKGFLVSNTVIENIVSLF